MTKRDLSRRLDALETPAREEYERAFRRAALCVVRELGATLTEGELGLVAARAGDEEDAATLRRYRASLPDKEAEKEREALLSAAYRRPKTGARTPGEARISESSPTRSKRAASTPRACVTFRISPRRHM